MAGSRYVSRLGFLLVVGLLCLSGCKGKAGPKAESAVVVTNSYLACAVSDVFGEAVSPMSLGGPGTCPGHFDIRPSQIDHVRRSRVFFYFDFQKGMAERIVGGEKGGPTAVAIRAPGGLNEPRTYLAVCRQVGEYLVSSGLADSGRVRDRLKQIERRMDVLAGQMKEAIRTSALHECSVLVSGHQSDFCRWLGLKVAGEFPGGDAVQVSTMGDLVRKGKDARVRLIVGNVPEGRQVADALGSQLGSNVVMLNNFPEPKDGALGVDRMLQDNVSRLVRGSSE